MRYQSPSQKTPSLERTKAVDHKAADTGEWIWKRQRLSKLLLVKNPFIDVVGSTPKGFFSAFIGCAGKSSNGFIFFNFLEEKTIFFSWMVKKTK